MPPEAFGLHIASDMGAGSVTRLLSERLDAPAVLCGYSRLLVDCNRHISDPTAFREISDGHVVPGNRSLSQKDKQKRVDEVRTPYHRAIDNVLAARQQGDHVPGLVSIHSFTPRMDGFERPWHVGILWDLDPRLAVPLLGSLNALPGLCVGDNEPYSGRHPADFTVDHHGEQAGRACVSVEVRQDLVATEEGAALWATHLAEPLELLAAKSEIFTLRADWES